MSQLIYPAVIPPGCTMRPMAAAEYLGGSLTLHVAQKLPAGFPSPAADYPAEPLDLNQYLVDRTACTFIFYVEGWSMLHAGLHSGDKVVVDKSVPPVSGHIVIAVVNSEFTFKRLRLIGLTYELHAENPDFHPIQFGDGEVLEVFGVVVGVVRRLR